MLAMNLRTTRGVRFPALSLTTIASMLAPTGDASDQDRNPPSTFSETPVV
jgi:hypothetical protein